MDYVDLGKRIRKQRLLAGLSREELAEKIGVSVSYVGHIERGLRSASLETLVDIANTLNLSVDYLLSASLTAQSPSLLSRPLSSSQRAAMQEILCTIEEHLGVFGKENASEAEASETEDD